MIKNKKEEKKNNKVESPIVSPVINKPEIKTTQVKQNRFSFTSAITSPTPSPRTTSNNNPKNMLLETKKTTNKKKKKSLTKQVLEQSKQLSPMSASSVSSWRSSLSRWAFIVSRIVLFTNKQIMVCDHSLYFIFKLLIFCCRKWTISIWVLKMLIESVSNSSYSESNSSLWGSPLRYFNRFWTWTSKRTARLSS